GGRGVGGAGRAGRGGRWAGRSPTAGRGWQRGRSRHPRADSQGQEGGGRRVCWTRVATARSTHTAPPPPNTGRANTVSAAAATIRARARQRHSSQRIAVEHAIAGHKQWRGLRRWTHHREHLPDTYRAVAGLVSHRDAMR
ncbi:hypothetical protein D8M34_18045, partial [Microbacterium sp. HSID17254]